MQKSPTRIPIISPHCLMNERAVLQEVGSRGRGLFGQASKNHLKAGIQGFTGETVASRGRVDGPVA